MGENMQPLQDASMSIPAWNYNSMGVPQGAEVGHHVCLAFKLSLPYLVLQLSSQSERSQTKSAYFYRCLAGGIASLGG
jgi:hypothetical protein